MVMSKAYLQKILNDGGKLHGIDKIPDDLEENYDWDFCPHKKGSDGFVRKFHKHDLYFVWRRGSRVEFYVDFKREWYEKLVRGSN